MKLRKEDVIEPCRDCDKVVYSCTDASCSKYQTWLKAEEEKRLAERRAEFIKR